MKSLLLSVALCFLQITSYAQPTHLFRNYLLDAIDTKMSSLAIADKYFCTDLLHRPGEDSEFARHITDVWLSGQRKNLREEQLQLDNVKFVRYDLLTPAEQPDKKFHLTDDPKRIYVALYNGKIVCYFLLQGDRIASTLLLGTGGSNSFIDYCATPG